MINNAAQDNKLPSICFVAQNAYGALSGHDTGHIGGIERQQAMMAMWLANKGYEVKMVTWDEFGEDVTKVSGVSVYRMCKRDAGVKLLRFFYPRWSSLNKAMSRANADIYYYNLGDLGLGQVVHWTKRHNKKTIYSVACDAHCEADLPLLGALRERKLFQYGLKNVDKIIVQSKKQQIMLAENFNRESEVIPMPSDGVAENELNSSAPTDNKKTRILWVGRLSEEKRLEWLLEIAEKCPEYMFDVLGSANYQNDYAKKLLEKAATLENVILHGRISHDVIGEYYRNASLLCCTSEYEGFPNVFLEAWSVGVPVISTVDPDDVIATHNLGRFVQSVEQFTMEINNVVNSDKLYAELSEAAINYYQNNHTIDSVMPKFESIFKSIAGRD